MLPQADTLHTIAEVGIAITGFAGIIVAIDRRFGTAQNVRSPLAVLLGASLGTVFFAFVPVWIASAIASPNVVWQLSCGLFGVFRLGYIGLIIHSLWGEGEPLSGVRDWILLAGGISLGVLLLVAALGALAEFHYTIYLAGLLWGLVVALRNFVVLLQSRSDE